MTAPTKTLLAPPSGITYPDPGILRPRSDITHTGSVGNVDLRFQWDTDSGFGGSVSEIVHIDLGVPTSGTYTLTVFSQTTAAIQWDDNAAAVKAALELLSRVHVVTVTGTGTTADPFVITHTDPINSDRNISDMTGTDSLDSTLIVTVNTQGSQGPPIGPIILNNSGNSFEQAPASDLGLPGPWYWRVAVVDRDDGAGTWSAAQIINYKDPIDYNRYLYHLANIGIGFHDTDEPAGGWGTGGTEGPDGDIRDDFNRYLSHLANVGVGFDPIDTPAAGWGPNSPQTDAPDGFSLDFDRYLYHLGNVDTTQPCPFMFSLSAAQVKVGNSVTVFGQGLVSADDPTDDWDAKVRLYESPDFAAAFVNLTVVTWGSGNLEDSITATVPAGATTGFIAIVHATTPSCAGSNFIKLIVEAKAPDREAGWWAHVANLRNSAEVIKPLPNVAGQSIEYVLIDQGVGNGKLVLQSDHPDLDTIVDPTVVPPISSLVKIFENDRYAYSFFADRRSKPYSEDGAEKVSVSGEGLESCLGWGSLLPYDHPLNPTLFPSWIWGSSDNLIVNGLFDKFDTDNVIENPSGEDGNDDEGNAVGWSSRAGATVIGVFDPVEAFIGDWYIKVDPVADKVHRGLAQTFSCEPSSVYKFNARIKENTAVGARFTMGVTGEDKGAINTGFYANLFAFDGNWECELDNVPRIASGNGCPGGSSDGTWQSFDIEIKTGPDQTSITVFLQSDHHSVCGGPGNIEFWMGELLVTGFGLNLDPWIAHERPQHASNSFVLNTVDLISGHNTVTINGLSKFAGIRQAIDVISGGRYTATIQAFTNDASVPVNETWILRIKNEDTDVQIAQDSKVPTGSGTVDKWQVSFDVPADTERIRFIFAYAGPNNPDPMFASIAIVFPGNPAATPGEIINQVLDVMNARSTGGGPGTLAFLGRSFTDILDSDGVAWTGNIALELKPSDTALQMVQRIQAAGFEWEVQPVNYRAGGDTGIELSVYNDLGKGINFDGIQDAPVIFPSVASMSGNIRKGTQQKNFIYVEGSEGIWSSQDSGDTILIALERREEWITNSRARDTLTTSGIALTRLEDHVNKAFAFQLNMSQNPDIRPNLDFLNGDVLRVLLPDDVPDDFFRIKGITGTLTGEGTDMRHSLDFTRLELEEIGARDRAIKRMLELLGPENITPGSGLVSDLPASGGVSSGGGVGVLGGGGGSTAVPTHSHPLETEITGRAVTGDLTGSVPGPLTVQALRGRSVAADEPADRGVLTWDEASQRWIPQPRLFWRPGSEGEYDDLFDSDSSADWTAVDPTGTSVWNIRHEARLGSDNRGLHVVADGQAASDYAAFLKPLTGIAIGDFIQAHIEGFGSSGTGEKTSIGLVLTDGVVAGSNIAGLGLIMDASLIGPAYRQMDGTLTAIIDGTLTYGIGAYGGVHVRVTYQAANTFRVEISLNGEDWTDLFGGDISQTMTPTHGGFVATADAGAQETIGLFRYFHSDVTS